jgi:hypothetical protein
MINPCDVRDWRTARAQLTEPPGNTPAERLKPRLDAIHRMEEIEQAHESYPGGFYSAMQEADDHIKRIVDGLPPLTDQQTIQLAVLLHGQQQ